MNYTQDNTAAIEGDDRNQYINESGAYEGVFLYAKSCSSEKGTQGIEFKFKSNDGAMANSLKIWTATPDGSTVNANGQTMYGYKQLCGLMSVLGVGGAVSEQATIAVYDFDQKKEVPTMSTIYPSLMNVPVGVILQSEEYYKQDSTKGKRTNIFGFYRVSDKAMPFEIGKNIASDGSRLQSILDGLKDKVIKPLAANGHITNDPNQYNNQQPSPDFDDDINF